jgi:hypothetical protein
LREFTRKRVLKVIKNDPKWERILRTMSDEDVVEGYKQLYAEYQDNLEDKEIDNLIRQYGREILNRNLSDRVGERRILYS